MVEFANVFKDAVETVIESIDNIIDFIDKNIGNYKKLIEGVFGIVKIFMAEVARFADLMPIGILMVLISPLLFLIAKFISVF